MHEGPDRREWPGTAAAEEAFAFAFAAFPAFTQKRSQPGVPALRRRHRGEFDQLEPESAQWAAEREELRQAASRASAAGYKCVHDAGLAVFHGVDKQVAAVAFGKSAASAAAASTRPITHASVARSIPAATSTPAVLNRPWRRQVLAR
jgi:hypothetical protein